MPLYEYECDACGHRFEVIQKHSDPPIDKCPVCAGSVHKLQSAPAFHLKGTGWYVTDYARKDAAKTAKSDGGATEAATDRKDKPADKSDKSEKSASGSGESASPAATASTSAKKPKKES